MTVLRLRGRRTRRLALAVTVLLTVVVPARAVITGAAERTSPSVGIAQQLAVPAYIDPAAGSAGWAQLNGSQPGSVGLVVANVDSGPGAAADPGWASVIHQAHAAGSKVLGYVDTGYLGEPTATQPGGPLTRAGQSGLQAWLPQAEADINAWYQFYGNDIDGIFLDEGANQCGPSGSTQYAAEYTAITALVKQAHPGALTVLNPGTAVPQCFEYAADVLVTFEGSYGDYTGSPVSPAEAYQPLPWSSTDPEKFWHIIYGTATQAQMEQVMALSKSRNAGYVYVTDGVLANPYDTVPPQAYWSDEQRQSLPVGTGGAGPPSAPQGLSAAAANRTGYSAYQGSSSTAAQLTWNESEDGGAPVVAYDVSEGGVRVASVDADTLTDTVTGLAPSGTVQFTVQARDAAGDVSAPSQGITVTTAAASTVLPSAPWQLQVTGTSSTTASLSWPASTSGGQTVTAYVVDQDGSPILTVPASLTSVTVQGLQPGLATYDFSVQAVGTTGSTSPPGNVVGVTTAPIPDDQAISAPSVQADPTGTVTYGADFATPFAFRRVFIATGAPGVPCWTTGNASPVCSDYLIENDQLLRYAGSGTDFTWTTVAPVSPALTGADHYSWTVPATSIGSPVAQTVLFNGDGYSPLTYTDLVAQGGASLAVNPPYTAAQAPALTHQVESAVQQADSVPPTTTGGVPAPAADPLCPSSPDDVWHVTRVDSCLSGTFSVARSLVDGLLPGSFNLQVTDVATPSPGSRSWTETSTVVLEPVSGTVPYYAITLAPACSDACGSVAPVSTTLAPGIPFTARFSWTDATTTVDDVDVSTSATLTPQLPPLSLPFTPVPLTAVVGWSTPVLRCDTARGPSLAGCVFPQATPTWTGLDQSSTADGSYARWVAWAQSNGAHWGLTGEGPPLAFTSNGAIAQTGIATACSGFFSLPWFRSWCDSFPFPATYQAPGQDQGWTRMIAPPPQAATAESALAGWEASEHLLDGDQFWVQVGS